MREILVSAIAAIYFLAAGGLLVYALNCYIMIALFTRRRREALKKQRATLETLGDILSRQDLPTVTTQIPVYNEYNVVERVMAAAAAMRYPAGKHEIQVLDDSTDETREIIDAAAARLCAQGVDIRVVRRSDRFGFKAGALANGLEQARGELIAIFDADFVPPPDYLLRTVPFFMTERRLGLVQARWGHLNRNYSLLTKVQSIGIDGHFMVEQAARTWNGLFMNFNGTAGIWRKEAILSGGGWECDTLTEDMDLSYRVQLAGWQTEFLSDLVVPAELPEDIGAFKSQQFRWAKGSIQTARKLLWRILRSDASPFKKMQAFLHLTHYMVHPLMVTVAVLALPVLWTVRAGIGSAVFGTLLPVLILSMIAPNALYICGQRAAYRDWLRRILLLPALTLVGVGVAISNTRAVVEALIGRQSGFVRTPKRGERAAKRYRVVFSWVVLVELLLGAYCACSLDYYLMARKYYIGPFLAIYAAGFLFVGMLTLAHSFGLGPDSPLKTPRAGSR